MSTQAVKELSVATHTAMDFLGYSEEMIKWRAEIVKHLTSTVNNKLQNLIPYIGFNCMVAGSVGDGIAKLHESDIDVIQVFRNFLCLDNAQVESELCIIQTITADSPPGHTRLNPLELDSNTAAMGLLCFVTEYDLSRGQVFLVSTCVRNFFESGCKALIPYFQLHGTNRELREQQGPSIPSTLHLKIPLMPHIIMACDADFVMGLPYIPSALFDPWIKRDRYWPPQSVCQDIMDTEAYVVPVGASYSENQIYEWRISFTTAESILVSNLNPVLLKVYIIFKMVNKYLIKPNCNILSSYMIKNVMFWVSEHSEPSSCNSPERLINLLQLALAFLRNCLHSKFLPNYMIQERNLLLGKGKPRDFSQLKCIISNLLDTDGFFVMEIEKVKTQIFSFRDSKQLSEMRDAFEIVHMKMHINILNKLSLENMFQPSLLYDVALEMYKNPLFFDLMFKLMNFAKLDIGSCIANPGQFFKVITNVLFS
ncbi:uncharacterized protein LOC132731098 [Ruditapes philippinarum]|uniref:uncharacterized protein LOC132731098 n=1 Tax=Ruditapes philippinarum TaxID=129788 RepID=UPI00295A7CD8|nr:uncharacterized protein LOC132731098 [Ruditapes philippinarum]